MLEAQATLLSACLPCRSKLAAVGPAPSTLRGYQQRAVDLAATGCNMILVGSTGAGKTAVAVARAEALILADPAARIVMLAPTVTLVTQQTGGMGWQVGRAGTDWMLVVHAGRCTPSSCRWKGWNSPVSNPLCRLTHAALLPCSRLPELSQVQRRRAARHRAL